LRTTATMATIASYSRCAVVTMSSFFLLATVAATCCSSTEELEVLDMVEKTVEFRGGGCGQRQTLELRVRSELSKSGKINDSNYVVRGLPLSVCL
jgi:hypothetical protein